jgi:hypothetical protein
VRLSHCCYSFERSVLAKELPCRARDRTWGTTICGFPFGNALDGDMCLVYLLFDLFSTFQVFQNILFSAAEAANRDSGSYRACLAF